MTETERLGLRERKKRETRAALSWATIRLAVERGFDQVRVEEIAAAAGVSPRTFNNYFGSKGEAIVARHLDRCLLFAEELRNRPRDEALWVSIRHAMRAQVAPGPEVEAHPVTDQPRWNDGVRLMVTHPAVHGELLRASAIAEAELAAAIAERTGTDATRDLYPRLLAATLMAANNAATQHWLANEPPGPFSEVLDGALARLAEGLPPPTAA